MKSKIAIDTKTIFTAVIVTILTLGLSLSLQSIFAQWTAPTQLPPSGNTYKPIYATSTVNQDLEFTTANTGLQIKGSLIVGDNASFSNNLNVSGSIKIGDTLANCNSTTTGTLKYNSSNKVQVCDGTTWTDLAGSTCAANTGAICVAATACADARVYLCDGTTCSAISYKPSGTVCTGGTCNGSGTCVATCSANMGNTCVAATACANARTYLCDGTCGPISYKPSGTVCTGGTCNGSGTCNPSCSQVNSEWNAWSGWTDTSGWGTCNAACNGTQIKYQMRSRTCNNAQACGGVNNCTGLSTDTQTVSQGCGGCSGNTPYCSGNTCVQCTANSHCGVHATCVSNYCECTCLKNNCWGDCDSTFNDGCETSLTTWGSWNGICGSCGHSCYSPGDTCDYSDLGVWGNGGYYSCTDGWTGV